MQSSTAHYHKRFIKEKKQCNFTLERKSEAAVLVAKRGKHLSKGNNYYEKIEKWPKNKGLQCSVEKTNIAFSLPLNARFGAK